MQGFMHGELIWLPKLPAAQFRSKIGWRLAILPLMRFASLSREAEAVFMPI
jgi:hypothetical protein